jgi:nitroimidazol reductase NimA-like FMN-containing flavoprotein (pyridoxamine 5'-phosphate oxidase superfamily)
MTGSVPHLDEALIRERLGRARLARVAFVDGEQPMILPVNVATDAEHRLVFRTAAETPLAGTDGRRVAVEIDGYDAATRSGWSVLVLGVARDVTTAADPAAVAARRVPVDSWAPGPRDRVLIVLPLSISGRAVPPSSDSDWFAGVPAS